MSELAPGSMSLEEADQPQETTPAAPPAPETPPTPQQSAPEATDQDPDGTIEGSGGVKFVPLGAVVDLRGKVREKESALAAKEAEIAALKEKAEKFDKINGDWQRVEPLLQKLESGQFQPPQPPKPQINPAAVEYAKLIDLYKSDGTPDVERAQKILDMNAAIAQQTAQAAVQPLYQTSAQQQSRALFEQVAALKDKNGVQVDRNILQRIWNLVPPEISQNPETARVLYGQAIAEMLWSGSYKQPSAPPPPPQFTESLGGNTTQTKELTELDRNIMSAAQMKSKDYESISANFKPGQRNALE